MAEETEIDSQEHEDAELLEKAKSRFSECADFYSKEYERGQEHLDFLLGQQWDEADQAKRKLDGRPCLTENRLLPFAHQVINDIRQARPAINVIPVDNEADPETAKIMRGMVRNIEVQSSADNVYDTGAWNAIASGYGWLRVNTRFVDENSFDQELELIRVPDFKSVMIDPMTKTMDGSDAEFGFVFEDIDREKFEDMYPDADPVSFDENRNTGWCEEDTVRIAEYFYKEYEEKTIYQLESGEVVEEVPEGRKPVNQRVVRLPSVKWCKITANDILERTDWPCEYIPLVPVYGEEVWQDGRRKSFSLISQAIDPQRRYNYWLTAETELIALQPKAPFIGITGQFATDGSRWARANNENLAYLQYDPVELPDGKYAVGAPQRQTPPMGSPAMFQHTMAAADGIKSTLGMFNASLGQSGNETSGKAILARQAEGDNSTFHFVDNLQSSIRQVGRILIAMIPKIYTGPRIVRIIGEDDKKMSVAINQAAQKQAGGNMMPMQGNGVPDAFYRLDTGKYDVVATVGASYATKRQETANMLQAVLQAAPDTFSILGDIFFKNLDLAEGDIIVERLRKMNPAMNDDQDPQAAQLQQAGQALQQMQEQLAQMDQALKAKREKDQAEVQAELQKTQAEIHKIEAETTKIQAEVAAAMAQTGSVTPEIMNEIVATIARLEAESKDTADAVEIILGAAEGANPQPIQPPQEVDQVTMPPEATALLTGENSNV